MLIITATITGLFFALKAANIKLPKVSLVSMDIIKRASGLCGGVLVKKKKIDQPANDCLSDWHEKQYKKTIAR